VRKSLGPVLRKARESAGLSLREVSRLSGMPVGQISQLETGVRPDPAFSTVARLAKVLKVSLDAVAAACGLLEEGTELKSELSPTARERAKMMTGIEDAALDSRRVAERLESLLPKAEARKLPKRRRL
jgi:transcriptional regulator with XRE-family HTH domain